MTAVGDLHPRVASEFEQLGLPSWPDPHPGPTAPRDEEYSRLTDPGRYRIVHHRARIWATVLADALGARPETVKNDADTTAGAQALAFDRGVRLVPQQSGALPLLFLEHDVSTQPGQATLAVLSVAVVGPDLVLERYPDCGCDACDTGSADLLEAVDAVVRRVVGGPYVVLRGHGWHAQWHPEGGSAGGKRSRAEFREVMEQCRRLADGEPVRLPRGTTAYVGQAWTG